jgi:Mrp family chromosome partitioning ATPase
LEQAIAHEEEVHLGTFARALWRAKAWIAGSATAAAIVAFAALSLVQPPDAADAQRFADGARAFYRDLTGPTHDAHEPHSPAIDVTNALSGPARLSLQTRGTVSAFAAMATALLALGFVLSRALFAGAEVRPRAPRSAPRPNWPRPTIMAQASGPLAPREPTPPIDPLRTPMAGIALSTERLLSIEPGEASRAGQLKPAPAPGSATPAPSAKALFERVHAAPGATEPRDLPGHASAGDANDLRSYLQRRAVLRTTPRPGKRHDDGDSTGTDHGRIRPTLKSLDAVIHRARGRAARNRGAILVAAGDRESDATGEAICLARALLDGNERGVLVDLSRGAAAVSGRLGLPRAPGFADLVAGRAGFEQVIHIDGDTALQVIPAGNPTVRPESNEIERTIGILEALAQAYDFILLHADRNSATSLAAALTGHVSLAIAVFGPGRAATADAGLSRLAALGCSVLPYEQGEAIGRPRRRGLLGRAAAI